jgi:hypothetical protein
MADDPMRKRAAALYNQTWDLLDDAERDAAGDRRLLLSACASRALWEGIGDAQTLAVGDWMVSRVLAQLGLGDLSVSFAQSAVDQSTEHDLPVWMQASALEGLARAYAAAGAVDERDRFVALAGDLVSQIPDAEDRDLIAEQLATVPEVQR